MYTSCQIEIREEGAGLPEFPKFRKRRGIMTGKAGKDLELEATNFLKSHGFTKTGRDLAKERVEKKKDPKPAFGWEVKGVHFLPIVAYHHGG